MKLSFDVVIAYTPLVPAHCTGESSHCRCYSARLSPAIIGHEQSTGESLVIVVAAIIAVTVAVLALCSGPLQLVWIRSQKCALLPFTRVLPPSRMPAFAVGRHSYAGTICLCNLHDVLTSRHVAHTGGPTLQCLRHGSFPGVYAFWHL